ncbi:murein biosynthesis integral membrane protein MurJ [Kineococcus sp. SYSU DK002]|uniref:murein biosynthesis integral membrane protein MurJ n=1 Tax=Kineococcus sp. SYSU DK002 TaxID=3383123 RepID=UPI003D7C7C76
MSATPDQTVPDESKASLARASALMASGTLVSRVLGFARSVVQGAAIGGTVEVGAQVFDVANKAPNVFYMLLAGGVLNAVLVPQIVRALKQPDGGKEYVDRLITLALLVMAVATALLTLAAPVVVRVYASSFSQDWIALTTALAFWCLPQVFFYGLYTVLGQVLNARGSFGPFMWAPVLNNVVAIAGLAVFMVAVPGAEDLAADEWTPGMVALLAGTATLGIVAQALVLFWPLRRIGFRYRPRFGFRGIGLRSAGRVAGWTFAAVVAGQLVFVLTTNTATRAGDQLAAMRVPGATGASYTYAYLLFMLPHSLVAVSLVTALFTRLASAAHAGDTAAVRRDFSHGARTVTVVGALATAGFVALGPWIGAAMVHGGRPIGQVLVAMSLGLVPFSVNYLVSRVFYAYEDARTPFRVALVNAVITAAGNVVCWVAVPPQWTVVGIGATMSVANVVACAVGLVLLRRHLRARDGRGLGGYLLLRTAVRVGIIAVVTGGLVFAGTRLVGPVDSQVVNLAVVLVGGVVVLVVFLGLCKLMRVRELDDLAGPLRRRLPGVRR